MHETYDSEIKRLAARNKFPVRLGRIGGGPLARVTVDFPDPVGARKLKIEPLATANET